MLEAAVTRGPRRHRPTCAVEGGVRLGPATRSRTNHGRVCRGLIAAARRSRSGSPSCLPDASGIEFRCRPRGRAPERAPSISLVLLLRREAAVPLASRRVDANDHATLCSHRSESDGGRPREQAPLASLRRVGTSMTPPRLAVANERRSACSPGEWHELRNGRNVGLATARCSRSWRGQLRGPALD
jgi:hypothetical protein